MQQSQEQAGQSVNIVVEIAGSMSKVAELVQHIQSMTHDVATATAQQNNATQAIEHSIVDIEQLADDAAQRANNAHHSSSILSQLSHKLSALVNGLKVNQNETPVV